MLLLFHHPVARLHSPPASRHDTGQGWRAMKFRTLTQISRFPGWRFSCCFKAKGRVGTAASDQSRELEARLSGSPVSRTWDSE